MKPLLLCAVCAAAGLYAQSVDLGRVNVIEEKKSILDEPTATQISKESILKL